MESRKSSRSFLNVIIRLVICAAVIFIGVAGMRTLAKMKKPPAEAKYEERPMRVEVLRVETEDVPIAITGYGEAKALNVVSLAPEVSGKIVAIHPKLEVGEMISKGDILFKIDPQNYKASDREAGATVRQLKNTIARLKKQYEIDRERMKTIERNRELAKAEFERIRSLFESDSVGTRSGVDRAEQAFNAAADQADQMAQTVQLYPIRIREAESSLSAARAGLSIARVNLKRCEVRAPFDGRVKEVALETGQYVTPGLSVLTLADDSVLEMRVPLDSRDARKWLLFSNENHKKTAWFNSLHPTPCKLRWTEDTGDHYWEGRLHRVVKFNQQTRTLTVAIRIKAKNALSEGAEKLPLVEGMFCSVEIPGKTLQNVMRLPRWAVSFENTVYVSAGKRLKTLPVEVARVQGEETFVAGGLAPGDMVITTRLVDPLENALLEIME
ncbi:biotin/lipoyl-binding protein [Desulfococcaceae bacterium HSG8]|nr:biotin/lipoyl-binding protein [Desulfococcaceae bacterium HSG8]